MKFSGSLYQCHDCGQHFAGSLAFGRHRTGEYAPGQRLCLTAADMRAIGMTPSAAGFWHAPIEHTARAASSISNSQEVSP
jgi:hypothetical protein